MAEFLRITITLSLISFEDKKVQYTTPLTLLHAQFFFHVVTQPHNLVSIMPNKPGKRKPAQSSSNPYSGDDLLEDSPLKRPRKSTHNTNRLAGDQIDTEESRSPGVDTEVDVPGSHRHGSVKLMQGEARDLTPASISSLGKSKRLTGKMKDQMY